MAPSTVGTFLRSFTFGHVRQLEAVIGRVLERAWIKRRSNVVGFSPNDATAIRIIGAVLADQYDEWAVARRYRPKVSMTSLTACQTAQAQPVEFTPGN